MIYLLIFVYLQPNNKIVYKVKYGPVYAGNASLEIIGVETLRGGRVWHIVSQERTNWFFSKIFSIQDRYDSYVDSIGECSVQLKKSIREGHYKNNLIVNFFPEKGVIKYSDGRQFPYFDKALDMISSIIYIGKFPLLVDSIYSLPVHIDGIGGNLKVKVIERERIKIPAGVFFTLRVKPFLPETKAFSKNGGMEMWYTDDERHIPVKISSKVFFGSITMEAKEIQWKNML